MTTRQLMSTALLLLLLSGSYACTQLTSPPVKDRANDVMKLICDHPSSYESYFSKDFLAHVPADQLGGAFAQYCSTLGSPVKVETITLLTPWQGTFNIRFANDIRVPLNIGVGLLAPHLITSFWMGTATSSNATSGSAAGREITFSGAGGLSLHGTLVLPVGRKGKVPGVLLLPGSGPTNRDGNQPPALVTDLLKQIAERLAQEGYASLRFDKRAAATYAKAWPADVAAQNDFFSWDSFIDDAKAALAFLQTQPEVDAERVVVAGHSEGATFAIQIGHDLQGAANAPAGLILMGSPGRTGAVILSEQVAANLKRSAMAAEQAQTYSDYVALAISQLQKDGTIPPNPPAGLGSLFPASVAKLMRFELALDPTKVVPVYTGPVLVVQGEKDIQISATHDTPLLEAALRQRSSGTYEVFFVPSASHNLKKVNDENKEPGITGPVAPEALDKIASWMKKNFPN